MIFFALLKNVSIFAAEKLNKNVRMTPNILHNGLIINIISILLLLQRDGM